MGFHREHEFVTVHLSAVCCGCRFAARSAAARTQSCWEKRSNFLWSELETKRTKRVKLKGSVLQIPWLIEHMIKIKEGCIIPTTCIYALQTTKVWELDFIHFSVKKYMEPKLKDKWGNRCPWQQCDVIWWFWGVGNATETGANVFRPPVLLLTWFWSGVWFKPAMLFPSRSRV